MFRLLPFIFLLSATVSVANSATCSFQNEINSVSWSVSNNVLQIHFEHNNLTSDRWTSVAFGNGPGMTMLEAIIFSRTNDVITTNTGYTPKKKRVVLDEAPYVTVKNVNLNGNHLKVTVTRPLGPAGPRNYSLDKCVNWIVLPGGSLKDGHFKKHHGGIATIKNVCAAQCTARKMNRMVLTNRFD